MLGQLHCLNQIDLASVFTKFLWSTKKIWQLKKEPSLNVSNVVIYIKAKTLYFDGQHC